MATGFAVAALGTLLLSAPTAHGSYFSDVLPGMLIAGLGLGVVLVCVSVSVMTGAKDEETGMLSGLNTTGHEIGGSIGIAVLGHDRSRLSRRDGLRHLVDGISDAFLVVAGIAAIASLAALIVLPSAATFLPKLRLAPRVALH